MRKAIQKVRKVVSRFQKVQLYRNSAMSGLQALVAIACTFLSYRILIAEVGLDELGLWTLMLAGASLARVADVTGSGGLARFVAEDCANGSDTALTIHTVTLTTLGTCIFLAVIAYVVAGPLIDHFVPEKWAGQATRILPVAVICSLVATPIAATMSSAVDGLRRADLRASISIVSYLALLAITFVWVPRYGLWMWGLAMVIQQLIVIVGCWLVIYAYLPTLWILPCRWSRRIFKKTVAYGLKLQVTSVAVMLSDPLAKSMIGHHGGLEAVGLYELAAKLVMSLRSLIVQAAQPIIAEFASLQGNRSSVLEFLRKTRRPSLIASIALFITCCLAAPAFSIFMFNDVRYILVVTIVVLALGYSINALSIPHYFAGVGLGHLRWNIGAHFSIAVCILLLGNVIAWVLGWLGVVVAMACGLVLSSAVIMIGNTRMLELNDLLKNGNVRYSSDH